MVVALASGPRKSAAPENVAVTAAPKPELVPVRVDNAPSSESLIADQRAESQLYAKVQGTPSLKIGRSNIEVTNGGGISILIVVHYRPLSNLLRIAPKIHISIEVFTNGKMTVQNTSTPGSGIEQMQIEKRTELKRVMDQTEPAVVYMEVLNLVLAGFKKNLPENLEVSDTELIPKLASAVRKYVTRLGPDPEEKRKEEAPKSPPKQEQAQQSVDNGNP